jgi:hypothetical protein
VGAQRRLWLGPPAPAAGCPLGGPDRQAVTTARSIGAERPPLSPRRRPSLAARDGPGSEHNRREPAGIIGRMPPIDALSLASVGAVR